MKPFTEKEWEQFQERVKRIKENSLRNTIGVGFYTLPLTVKSKKEEQKEMKIRNECLICKLSDLNELEKNNNFYCPYAEKVYLNGSQSCSYFIFDDDKVEKFPYYYNKFINRNRAYQNGVIRFPQSTRERFINYYKESQKIKQLEIKIKNLHKRTIDLEFYLMRNGRKVLQGLPIKEKNPDLQKGLIFSLVVLYFIGFWFWIGSMILFIMF